MAPPPRLWAALWAAAAALARCEVDEEGKAFLAANALEEGVVTLDSGLQYKVLEEGEAGPTPQASLDSDVVCHYEGKLINGEVFDSSYKRGRPATFKPKNVVKGWTEALQLMRAGDKWELVVPPELGYGAKGAGNKIPPNAVLVFTLEVVEVKGGRGAPTKSSDDWETWLHEPVFHIGPFPITRTLTLPMLAALFVSWLRIIMRPRTYAVARHIVSKTEEQCYKALSRCNKGEDFGEVAKELSTCSSAKKGGALGKFNRGTYPPEFEKVVFDTKKTEIGKNYGPIKTQFGYHVLRVEQRHISEDDEMLEMRESRLKEEARKRR